MKILINRENKKSVSFKIMFRVFSKSSKSQFKSLCHFLYWIFFDVIGTRVNKHLG